MRYRLEVRLTAADVGKRVVVRWRRPATSGSDEVADVLGILAAADDASFTVRRASGEIVVIPRERALAGKPVPPPPGRRARRTHDTERPVGEEQDNGGGGEDRA